METVLPEQPAVDSITGKQMKKQTAEQTHNGTIHEYNEQTLNEEIKQKNVNRTLK